MCCFFTITNAFQTILGKSNRKPNEKWVDKGTEFCNRLMESWYRNLFGTQ